MIHREEIRNWMLSPIATVEDWLMVVGVSVIFLIVTVSWSMYQVKIWHKSNKPWH